MANVLDYQCIKSVNLTDRGGPTTPRFPYD